MRLPIHIVTGFLGSGKTTLLKRLLATPAFADTAVLVNELGEIALDHELLERVDESTVVLAGGCLCCAVRNDLSETIRDLLSRRERGEIPRFRQVVIETTGLADPGPIVRTLVAEPVLRHHVRCGSVIVTLDALHGEGELDRHAESMRQLAAADFVIITKTDLASDRQAAAVEDRARLLNPVARIARSSSDDVPALLDQFAQEAAGEFFIAGPGAGDRMAASDALRHGADSHAHDADRVLAICVTASTPVDWSAFGLWLSMLLHCHGPRVLRTKALLHVAGLEVPVLVESVQYTAHAPVHLPRWPSADQRSRIVVIVDGLSRASIEQSLAAFCNIEVPGGADLTPVPSAGTAEVAYG
jgi:G3E family GTPase